MSGDSPSDLTPGPQDTRPLFRRRPPSMPAGPIHSQALPTSPLRPSRWLVRTLLFCSTTARTLCHIFSLWLNEWTLRRTSSLRLGRNSHGSSTSSSICFWLASRSSTRSTRAGTWAAAALLDRKRLRPYRAVSTSEIRALIWRRYRASPSRTDLLAAQMSGMRAREVDVRVVEKRPVFRTLWGRREFWLVKVVNNLLGSQCLRIGIGNSV